MKLLVIIYCCLHLVIDSIAFGNPNQPQINQGSLMIMSQPPGANVHINGQNTGMVTPIGLCLKAQSYQIRVIWPRYGAVTLKALVNKNMTTKLTVYLGQFQKPELTYLDENKVCQKLNGKNSSL